MYHGLRLNLGKSSKLLSFCATFDLLKVKDIFQAYYVIDRNWLELKLDKHEVVQIDDIPCTIRVKPSNELVN